MKKQAKLVENEYATTLGYILKEYSVSSKDNGSKFSSPFNEMHATRLNLEQTVKMLIVYSICRRSPAP